MKHTLFMKNTEKELFVFFYNTCTFIKKKMVSVNFFNPMFGAK